MAGISGVIDSIRDNDYSAFGPVAEPIHDYSAFDPVDEPAEDPSGYTVAQTEAESAPFEHDYSAFEPVTEHDYSAFEPVAESAQHAVESLLPRDREGTGNRVFRDLSSLRSLLTSLIYK